MYVSIGMMYHSTYVCQYWHDVPQWDELHKIVDSSTYVCQYWHDVPQYICQYWHDVPQWDELLTAVHMYVSTGMMYHSGMNYTKTSLKLHHVRNIS